MRSTVLVGGGRSPLALGGTTHLHVQNVTIIREFNCYESTPSPIDRVRQATGLAASVPCRSMVSVWLAFSPYEHARDDHDYTTMGTRIIGPVSEEQAESVIQQLGAAFASAGFHVVTEVAADD